MSGISDLVRALKAAKDALIGTHDKDAVQIASDLYALTQNRIIQKGEDSKGIPFRPYAPLTRKLRTAKGRQIAHVDLFFTGQMWRNSGVQITSRYFGGVKVEVIGKTPDAKRKVDLNSQRYGGNILQPSIAEINTVKAAYLKRRLSRIRI